MDTNVISQLIQQHQDKEIAKQEESKAKWAQFIRDAEAALRGKIGDALWKELFPFMRSQTQEAGSSLMHYVFVEAVPLELAPLTFRVRKDSYGNFSVQVNLPAAMSDYSPIDELPKALARAREQFPEWNAKRLEKLTEPLRKSLYNCVFPDNARTSEEADRAMKELIKVWPARESAWRELRAGWDKAREAADRNEQEADRQAAERSQALELYEKALETFYRETQAVVNHNRALCQALQGQLAGSVTHWRLTYALLGEDEDGTRAVETRTCNVMADAPSDGYWPVIERWQVNPVRFWHPVSLEGPFTDPVEESPVAGAWRIQEALGFTLHFAPGTEVALVNALGIQPLPTPPSLPDTHYYDAYTRVQEITQAVPKRLIAAGVLDADDAEHIRAV